MMRNSRAFTLVELLIAIAVASILMLLAAPSFNDLILVQRLKGTHAQLLTDLQYARSEAVGRGTDIYVQFAGSSDSATTCYSIFACESTTAAECTCDCSSTPASCSVKVVNPPNLNLELRSVRVESASGVLIEVDPDLMGGKLAYEHITGGMRGTAQSATGSAMPVSETFIETSLPGSDRALRAQILGTGRLTSCLARGQVSGVSACTP